MLVTYDEVMEWYQKRREKGLTIEPPSLLERYEAKPMPIIPLRDTCRWHIPGKWGSEYCDGRHCQGCTSWMMHRAEDFEENEDPWKYWRK